VNGLIECIERDAFLMAWYRRERLARLQLEPERISSDARQALEYLHERGLEVTFYELHSIVRLPTVLAVGRASRALGSWPAGGRALSANAATDAARAAQRGIGELLGHYTLHACTDRSQQGRQGVTVDAATPLVDLSLHDVSEDRWQILDSSERRSFAELEGLDDASPAAVLAHLVDAFRALAMPVHVRPLSTLETRVSGLSAVRVVVPGLLRPARSRGEVFFGVPRLEGVDLNPLVHPQI
jgi:ribosomal protein S12 methylthiotransferase accessory factor YcaO